MNDFLVQLANESETVREYLNVKDWKNIVKITPESVHRFVGMKNGVPQYQAKFIGNRRDLGVSNILMRFANERVFQHLDKKYGYSEETMFQNTWKPQLVKYATGSFKPDAGTGSTTVDARVYNSNAGTDWATLHDAATGSGALNSETTLTPRVHSHTVSDEYTDMWRLILTFDTSALTTSATVTDTDFDFYGTAATDQFTGANCRAVSLCGSTPTANNNIVAGDYNQLGSTIYAPDKSIVSIASSYNTWSMNATGIANVVVDGITRLGLGIDCDIQDITPTWESDKFSSITGNAADNGSLEPLLTVTYTLPATGNMLLMF